MTQALRPVVQIDDLRMQFINQGRVNEAISGITLAVGEGEIVGLVGESGSGKSVTAMNILQLLPKRSNISIRLKR